MKTGNEMEMKLSETGEPAGGRLHVGDPTRIRCRKLPVTNFGGNGGGKRG